jgi:hypothetical protein
MARIIAFVIVIGFAALVAVAVVQAVEFWFG